MNILFFSFLISLIAQVVFFAYAAYFKTDKVTDLSYGLTFIIVALAVLLKSGNYSPVNTTLFVLILLWGMRISGYLFVRILKIKKDRRFDGIRENFFKFAQFWTLQAISVWLILIPSILVLSLKVTSGFSFLQFAAILFWAGGFILETVADIQKFNFKNEPKNKNKWTNVGLWKHIRHPNYLGEMMMWWAIFLYSFPLLTGWQLISIISPFYISFLLIFVTGIPTLEKKYNEKFKNNKEYQTYLKNTYKLIPFVY